MSPPFPEQLVPSRSPPYPPVTVHMAMHLACEGARISFHHCFQSMINTVVPPPPGADSKHPQQFVTACFRACTRTCMSICAPWVRSSSWHSAPWRDEEAKCRGEKPLSFSLKKKKKKDHHQLATASTKVLRQANTHTWLTLAPA